MPNLALSKRLKLDRKLGPLGNPLSKAGVFPFVATGLPLWQAAARNVKAGSANATVLMVGDSTTRLAKASGSAQGINAVPFILSGLMNSTLVSSCNNFLSQGGITGTAGLTDSRVNTGAWSVTGSPTEGGVSFVATSAATFAFTPGASFPFDTIKTHYAQFGAGGILDVNVDGGASLGTINTGGTNAPKIVTRTCALGTHTANILWSSGTCVLVGVEVYNSTTGQVSWLNGGWGGATTTDWNNSTQPYNPIGWVGMASEHILTTICLGINDWETGVPTATTSANLQAIITAAKLAGDVLLVTPNTTNGVASLATQATYVSVIQGLAVSNSVKLLDLWTNVFGGVVQAPWMVDTLHPNAAGIAQIAAAYKTALTT